MVAIADKDAVTKLYMQDNATFADAFNFLLYDGEQVIRPEQLRPLDTSAITLPYATGEKPSPVQKYRDVLKSVVAMTDDHAAYLLLGIENQSQIHYAMPVRNLLYDAIQYAVQVDRIASAHKTNKDTPETKAEFLSGFFSTDKLLPVITMTLYFGPDEWTAPKDLHSMLSANEHILKFVDNYHLHLIAPADIADKDFEKFHTELCPALRFVKYSKNMEQLKALLRSDNTFRSISKRTADMLNIVTNAQLHYPDGKERVDMCEAIEGIRNEGIAIGLAKGRAEGKAEGRTEGMLELLIGLVKDGLLSVEDAAVRIGMSAAEFKKKMEQNP